MVTGGLAGSRKCQARIARKQRMRNWSRVYGLCSRKHCSSTGKRQLQQQARITRKNVLHYEAGCAGQTSARTWLPAIERRKQAFVVAQPRAKYEVCCTTSQ